MIKSSSSKSIVVLFVPFAGSPKDFVAKLREGAAFMEISGIEGQAGQAEIKSVAAETLPLWTWFIPNPCPNDSD
jgi:hypothetical protein